MQYSQGTVAFVNGSPTVVGTGTNWSAGNVLVGHQIHHDNFPLVPYTIGNINYTTQTITLSSNYAGSSDPTASYQVVTDFTPNLNLPELNAGDLNAPAILTRALRKVDTSVSMGSSQAIVEALSGTFPQFVVILGGPTPPSAGQIATLVSWGVDADNILYAPT
jgi:hypothetical protein